MNKWLMRLLLFAVILLMVIGCEVQNNQEEDNEMEKQIKEEVRQVALFVEEMGFTSTVSREYVGLIISPVEGVEFIFVHNEEEAKEILPDMSKWRIRRNAPDFPPDTIVVWPGSIPRLQGRVNGINWFVLEEEIDLADFSLSDPIAVEDVIDDWEKVKGLWESFGSSIQSHIIGAANRQGAEAFVQDLEAFYVAGDMEVLDHAIQRGLELELGWDASFGLLIALGCVEEYHAVLDRLEKEEITIEEIMEMIEE